MMTATNGETHPTKPEKSRQRPQYLRSRQFDLFANRLINWIGSKSSLVLHTLFFVAAFVLKIFGIGIDQILLVLTTLVSLEAIYLAIFIQYSVNQHSKTLQAVAEDIEEVTEDIEDVEENVEELTEDVESISEDLEKRRGKNGAAPPSPDYAQLEQTVKLLLEEVRRLNENKNQQ